MTNWDFVALLAIFIFGVPHGGFDAAIARRNGWSMGGSLSWVLFHLAYILIAAIVAILWWWFPLTSLSLFLLISGYHFGASDLADVDSHWLPWLAHGGLVSIAIPNFHVAEVLPIFSLLAGAHEAEQLMQLLSNLFFAWVACCIGYCIFTFLHRDYLKPLVNLLILIVIACLLPPLIGFALYFCFWHSRGHILRLWRSLQKNQRYDAMREAIIYTIASWTSAVLFFFYLNGSISDIMLQLTFIGLAALTWPHMVLVDYMDKWRIPL
jgi:Brp/Blh family beta-carotene 15,15'-monooxygenase